MVELKKCPFCGSDAISIGERTECCGHGENMGIAYVKCEKCGGKTEANEYDYWSKRKAQAIGAWNNRVTEAEIRAKAISDTIEAIKEHTRVVGSTTCEDLEQLAEQLMRE